MSRKGRRRKNQNCKNHSVSPSNKFFFCRIRGCKLPTSPIVCERCKKRCSDRPTMIGLFRMVEADLLDLKEENTKETTRVQESIVPEYTEVKKKPEKKVMKISLDSYEED